MSAHPPFLHPPTPHTQRRSRLPFWLKKRRRGVINTSRQKLACAPLPLSMKIGGKRRLLTIGINKRQNRKFLDTLTLFC